MPSSYCSTDFMEVNEHRIEHVPIQNVTQKCKYPCPRTDPFTVEANNLIYIICFKFM